VNDVNKRAPPPYSYLFEDYKNTLYALDFNIQRGAVKHSCKGKKLGMLKINMNTFNRCNTKFGEFIRKTTANWNVWKAY